MSQFLLTMIKPRTPICLLAVLIFGQGCSNYTHQPINNPINSLDSYSYTEFRPLSYYAETMSNALIANSRKDIKDKRVAVGTILKSLNRDNENRSPHPFFQLGNLLQEELISAMGRKFVTVVEYRTTQNIIMEQHSNTMLSNSPTEITASQSIDYFLTGTYSNNSNGASINLRLIDAETNNVISTDSQFIPINVFERHNAQTTKSINGYLYRSSPAQ